MAKRPVTQKRLLQGIKKIHREYKYIRHNLDVDECPLCLMYMDKCRWENDCSACPMNVFKGKQRYSCMNRQCRPINCTETDKRYYLPLLVDFYERFIKKVEGMTDEQLQAKNAWKFLKALDKRVYNKHLVIE